MISLIDMTDLSRLAACGLRIAVTAGDGDTRACLRLGGSAAGRRPRPVGALRLLLCSQSPQISRSAEEQKSVVLIQSA